MKSKVLAILSLCVLSLAVSGCNTIYGLGKDIRIVGEQLEKIAGGGG